MAVNKGNDPSKGMSVCLECNIETDAKRCPQCGNEKLEKLAPDGIEQRLHGKKAVFGSTNELKSTDLLVNGGASDDQTFVNIAAKKQLDEMSDNMRETYVLKSQIKKTDLEMEILRKQEERDALRQRLKAGYPAAPAQNGPGPNNGNQNHYGQPPGYECSVFGPPMSPQAVFMSQLMKMDKEKRHELLTQLGEADPAALAAMASMFGPSNYMGGGQPQGGYGQTPLPPWMMQQMAAQWVANAAPQPAAQKDPLESALSLITVIRDFMKGSGNSSDDGVKEMLKEISRKLDPTVSRGGSDESLAPVLKKIEEIEGNLGQVTAIVTKPKGAAESIRELNELVSGLEEAGLVTRPSKEGKTVDDEIKLSESKHRMEAEDKKLSNEAARIAADKARAEMGKSVLTSMFSRSLNRVHSDDQGEEPVKKVNLYSSSSREVSVEPSSRTPPEVVSEMHVDGAVIRETRAPVRVKEEV